MRLGKRRIKFDRALRGAADLGRSFIRGDPPAIKEKDVGICQPGIGLRIVWILGDRLVQLIQRLVNALVGALRQVKASFQIELVGRGIIAGMLLLFAIRLSPHLAGYVGSYVVLCGSDGGGVA